MAIDRYLDALKHVMVLDTAAELFTETVTTAATLREAVMRLRGDHVPELAEIGGFLGRLRRYQD